MQQEAADKICLLEEQYQQALLRLQHAEANQLKLKKTIVALCNEILHPLNGILGSTELIEGHITDLTRNLKSPDATTINKALTILLNINKSIAAIKTCAHHHKIITHDLLELAKLEVNTEQVEV